MLGVEAFGEVSALFSLLLIVSVPAAALTMLMTREAAFQQTAGVDSVRALFRHLRKHVTLASIIFWVLFLCAVPILGIFLQISYTPLFIFSVLIPVTLHSALQAGTLQGLQEFFSLSKQNILSTLVKLLVSLWLVYDGYSVLGVMVGLVLASIASWGYGYFLAKKVLGRGTLSPDTPQVRSLRSLFSIILSTTLLLALLSNIDVIMAKHFLSPIEAGKYGALSTLGKILIYGIGAFITVLLPMVSAAHAKDISGVSRGGEGSKILLLTLLVIAVASGIFFVLFTFFGVPIVGLLFGGRYVQIAPLIGTFSIAMGAISLSTALINYFVAVENKSFIVFLLLSIVVEVVLFVTHHSSIESMTGMLALSSIFLLLCMIFNYMILARKHTT